jgi:hypothetical protein
MAALHQIALPPALLKKGFWIYVWRIRRRGRPPTFYVGMTGDTGSGQAQSPINRVSAHLGPNERSNALRRYLGAKGIEIETCDGLEFAAYGPIGSVPTKTVEYRVARARIAALEKHLWQVMEAEGRDMLNRSPSCRTQHNPELFEIVRAAFVPFFEKEASASKTI